MALPVSLSLRTVTFTAEKGDGTPETGTVSFQRTAVLQSGAEDLFITPYTKTVTLDAGGSISVPLPVTDDPDWPAFLYNVHIQLSAWEFPFVMELPTSGSPLDLADVIGTTTPPDPPSAYVLLANVGEPGGPAGPLDMDGLIPPAQYVSGGGGGGSVTSVNGHAGVVVLVPSDIGAEPHDTDLTTIGALTPANNDFLQRKSAAWTNRTIAQVLTDLAHHATHESGGSDEVTLAQAQITGLIAALAAKQTLDADLTTIAGLTPTGNDMLMYLAGAWANRTPAQIKASLAIAQSDVSGLPTALTAKADLIAGKVDPTQIPDLAIVQFLGSVGSQAAMLALTGQSGDFAIRTDTSSVWIITGTPTTSLGSWTQMVYPTAPVISVAGKTGAVTLVPSDAGAQPLDSDLTAIAALTPAASDIMQFIAGAWVNRTMAQLFTSLGLGTAATQASTAFQAADSDLATIAGLTATTDNFIVSVASAWASRTPAQVKATLAIVQGDVSGLTAALALLAPLASPAFTGTMTAVNQTLSGRQVITPDSLTVVSAHVSTDASLGNVFYVAATASFTLDNPTNPTDGQTVHWIISQDVTGGRVMTLGTAFALGPNTVTLSTGTVKRDHLIAMYNATATKWDILGFQAGF